MNTDKKEYGISVIMPCYNTEQYGEETLKSVLNQSFKDYEIITTVGATPKEIEPYKVFKQTMTADDILSGKKFPGRKIVIIGGGSYGVNVVLSEF